MTIATRVENALSEAGIGYELVTHPRTGSTHESAEAADVPEDHIAKAVMVRDDDGDAMAVIRGDSWLQLDTLNEDTARRFRLEDEPELGHLFPDCEPGAVPPLGPAYGLTTYLDEALTTLAEVFFEAGDHRHLVRVQGEDFLRLLEGVRRGHYGGRD